MIYDFTWICAFLGAFAKLRKVTISSVIFVCPSVRLCARPFVWNNSIATGRISMKFDVWVFFRKCVAKIQVSLKPDQNNNGTLREDVCAFMISCWSVSDKFVEKIKTHILFSINFPENRGLFDIMWETVVGQDRPQVTIWRMRIAGWITEVTHTHARTHMYTHTHTHTLRICFSSLTGFSTVIMVTQHSLMLHCTCVAYLVGVCG